LYTVPFPGADWLQRLATPETIYQAKHNGLKYTSVYAAILNNAPLENPVRNFNAYINSIFLPNSIASYVTSNWCNDNLEVAHYMLCYLRNLLGGIVVYYGVAAIFHYFIYVHPSSKSTFEDRARIRPTASIIWDQIKLAQASMFIYVSLPVIDEYLVEQGWTMVYHTVAEIGGWPYYIAYMVLYFALVEIGIYWMHRTLHTNKFLYRHVHMLHHKYNKPETLTPWASIAFHPLDGMMQACPYVLALPLVPCHYLTHFFLLFFTAIWATYIHDAMDWNIEPIMGSKYHTVHHTHYIYNYGQVFTFCDRIWGTYRLPEGPTGVSSSRSSRYANPGVKKEL
jgi:lathosterol oxidase